jgi:uncharacterized membrane protein YheB (UPF0754 family)
LSWLIYLSMPLLAAFIGYTTKLVAIEMMFRPLEFVGRPPYLGWQGIIPRYAGRIGSIAVGLLLGRLVNPSEILGRLDPGEFVEELVEPLNRAVTEIGTDLMTKYQPWLWEMLSEDMRRRVLAQIAARAPRIVAELVAEFAKNPDAYLDVQHMALQNLAKDPGLLNRLFKKVGQPELRFIARSGLVFGLIIGLLQALV